MNIALITSTIAPASNVHLLARTDVAQRLEDYKTAFAFYCDQLAAGVFDKLVYVDNSGHDLEQIKRIATHKGLFERVEFISYTSNVNPVNNRFFLEMNLIDYYVKNSQILRENPDCTVWKITGRYLIINISKIIERCSVMRADIYVNMRNHPYKVVDFYLVGFKLAAYAQLFSEKLAMYEGLADGEVTLRRYIDLSMPPSLRIQKRLPVTPRIVGVRGFDGGTYGGLKDTTKFYIRMIFCKLFPFVWL